MFFCKRKFVLFFITVLLLFISVSVYSFADSNFVVMINKISESEKAREFSDMINTNPLEFAEDCSFIPIKIGKFRGGYEIINIDIIHQSFSLEDVDGFQEITQDSILKGLKLLVNISENGEIIYDFDESTTIFIPEYSLDYRRISNEARKIEHMKSLSKCNTVAEFYFERNTGYRNLVLNLLEEFGFYFF